MVRCLSIAMLASVALTVISTAALAAPTAKSESQCFYTRDVNNFSAPDDHTVYIRVGVRDVYRLDLMTDCLDLSFRHSLTLESLPANPWICSPLEATVIGGGKEVDIRCPVKAIHKLTPDEALALPKRDRP